MLFYFTSSSVNKKTGPMPVVTATSDTCPTSCALKGNGCYAEGGHLGMFWKKLNNGKVNGLSLADLLQKVRSLPRTQMWRYGQAGDLPDDKADVLALADANRHRPVIAYTHKRDYATYREAGRRGFNINLSTDDLDEADDLVDTGLPVVTLLPSEYARSKGETLREFRDRIGGRLSLSTPAGNKVAICPATYLDTNCLACGACSKPRAGGTIIGFPAHGVSKSRVNQRLRTTGIAASWTSPNSSPM